ncbi:MAG: sigma-70 family RNA polymerase sigma factor [Prevotella sp.]|nr:sigma-70 family RNA polymerase sigma factor [Prevotella sp.]
MQETERQLIGAIRAGDREALRRLYERFSRFAMGVVLRYVPEREDALDITQDSFINILTNIGTFEFRGEGSLKSWVAKIASNQALEWIKKHERLSFSDQLPDGIEDNDDEAAIEEVPPDLLNEMIGQLPTRYRIVVNLYAFGQLSHKDIGQKLDISEKASATIFSRAKRKLAKMMKEYLDSQGI